MLHTVKTPITIFYTDKTLVTTLRCQRCHFFLFTIHVYTCMLHWKPLFSKELLKDNRLTNFKNIWIDKFRIYLLAFFAIVLKYFSDFLFLNLIH